MRVFIFTFLRFASKSLIIIITKICVLKYIGDAIIAFFPSGYNKLLACHKAVQCANPMITVIKNGINPTLDQYDYPEKILEIANNKDVNTIVIGSRGLSTAKEFLLGSIFLSFYSNPTRTIYGYYSNYLIRCIYVDEN
jgi:Universal stress protein family